MGSWNDVRESIAPDWLLLAMYTCYGSVKNSKSAHFPPRALTGFTTPPCGILSQRVAGCGAFENLVKYREF